MLDQPRTALRTFASILGFGLFTVPATELIACRWTPQLAIELAWAPHCFCALVVLYYLTAVERQRKFDFGQIVGTPLTEFVFYFLVFLFSIPMAILSTFIYFAPFKRPGRDGTNAGPK